MAENVTLDVGQDAPGIRHAVTGGGEFDLAANSGKWVAVYFFPRANTPG